MAAAQSLEAENRGQGFRRAADAQRRAPLRRSHPSGLTALKTDLFSPADLAAMTIDLSPGDARTGTVGYVVATQDVDAGAAKS
jgi:hypothetical protein